jgi:hypothetical protein
VVTKTTLPSSATPRRHGFLLGLLIGSIVSRSTTLRSVGEVGLRRHHPRSATPATFGLCTVSVSWVSLRCTGANETLMPLVPCEFCCAGMIPHGGAYLRRRRYGWPCSGVDMSEWTRNETRRPGTSRPGPVAARAGYPKRRDASSPESPLRRRRRGDPGHVAAADV